MLHYASNNRKMFPGPPRPHYSSRTRRLDSRQLVIITLVALLAAISFVACLFFTDKLSEIAIDPRQSRPASSLEAHEAYQEKFLAYIPHSGLSNQRIELANALLLAALLQRTLIIPPAFLGTVVGWMKREQLYDHLGWLTNASVEFETLCRRPTPGDLGSYVVKNRCLEYRQFGVVHWTELHDLDLLKPYVNFRFQDMVSLEQLQHDLGIDEEDTYVHEDKHLYDWKLYEDISEAKRLLKTHTNFFDSFGGRRYYKVYTLDNWRRRPERLLQLGGIFSSTRLSLIDPAHIALREKIASALHYRRDNTAIGETVQRIVKYLGGKGSYVSVHFRTGDTPFKRQINQNMVLFAEELANLTGASITLPELLPPNGVSREEEQDPSSKRMMLLPPSQGLNTPPWSRVCEPVPGNGRPITSGSHTTIYIATDHRDPRGPESQILPWFDMYPCTVTLSDLPDYLFDPLDRVHDYIVPAKSLRPFLIPIVDGMVAAHASQVLTTPRSTYSRYIDDMNHAWIQ